MDPPRVVLKLQGPVDESVGLLLQAHGDPAEIEAILRGELDALLEARLEETLGTFDGPEFSSFETLRLPEGVYFELEDSDYPEGLLARLAAGLTGRGLRGTITAHHLDTVARDWSVDHLLDLRVRVRGRRWLDGDICRWQPDVAALTAFLAAADAWRTSSPGPVTTSVRRGLIEPIEAPADVSLAEMGDLHPPVRFGHSVCSRRADGERAVILYDAGTVAVVRHGPSVGDACESALEDLRGLLLSCADLVVYARVTRSRGSADRGMLFDPTPWPSRARQWPHVPVVRGAVFEDVFAPDAYGMQLLGPVIAERLPDQPDWEATPAGGGGGVLLAHRHPERWFGHDFPGHRTLTEYKPTEVPPIVAEARAQLAPVLYTPEALDDYLRTSSDLR